ISYIVKMCKQRTTVGDFYRTLPNNDTHTPSEHPSTSQFSSDLQRKSSLIKNPIVYLTLVSSVSTQSIPVSTIRWWVQTPLCGVNILHLLSDPLASWIQNLTNELCVMCNEK